MNLVAGYIPGIGLRRQTPHMALAGLLLDVVTLSNDQLRATFLKGLRGEPDMKTMTWEEIDKDWSGLQRRHRMEVGEAVARYCVGHSISQVANHLGFSNQWVRQQLDFAGTAAVVGASGPPLSGGRATNVQKELPKLIQEFAPAVEIDKHGELSGDDADEFASYLDHYREQGHEPAAAQRLAKAEWATEAAVEAGAIQERTKDNKKVNQILFGDDRNKTTFELDLQLHMSRVKSAARFLDEANMADLKRAATRDKVAESDAAWREQMERMLNLHPTLLGD